MIFAIVSALWASRFRSLFQYSNETDNQSKRSPLVVRLLISGIFVMSKEAPETVEYLRGLRHGAVRFCSHFGQILVRFFEKIGQIVSPIFWNFGQI